MATAVGSYISYLECRNLKLNAAILGWLGIIISSVVLCCSFLTFHMQFEIEEWLKSHLLKGLTKEEQQFLTSLLAILSHTTYGLSLLNTGVSVFLLIGVALDISVLLYPWIIFNGSLLGLSCFLALYYITAGLFMDLFSFLLLFLVLTLIIAIFYKIYHEVYILADIMRHQKRFRASRSYGC